MADGVDHIDIYADVGEEFNQEAEYEREAENERDTGTGIGTEIESVTENASIVIVRS
uniref:Cleavage and polyadenylation specific factor 6 n=2 Tax=Sus scrofa TaxID=9823 RepID=A0A4X1VXK4_PIG